MYKQIAGQIADISLWLQHVRSYKKKKKKRSVVDGICVLIVMIPVTELSCLLKKLISDFGVCGQAALKGDVGVGGTSMLAKY